MAMKRNFELEISEWKTKLTDAQNFIAQMKIQIDNVQQDNKKLNIKYAKYGGGNLVHLWGYQRWVSFRKAEVENSYFRSRFHVTPLQISIMM